MLTKSEVFERYGVELTRFATSMVGPADAPDVVSDTLLRVMWSDAWDEVEHQRAYLYRAVTSQCRMLQRSAVRRRQRERGSALAFTVDPPDGDFDVWDALNRLSVRERAVVFLTYWEDLTETASADRLGISERTVRRQLTRARHKLGRMLR